MPNSIKTRWWRILLRGLLWIAGLVAGALLITLLVLHSGPVQNRIVDAAEQVLSERTGASVRIERFRLFPTGTLVLKGFLVIDPHADTIASIGNLSVNVALMPLLKRKLHIASLTLKNPRAILFKPANADAAFNFRFIIDSLSSGTPRSTNEPWSITAGRLSLISPDFLYHDRSKGIRIAVGGTSIAVDMRSMDLQTLHFDAKKVHIEEMDVEVRQGRRVNDEGDDSVAGRSGTNLEVQVSEIALGNSVFSLYDSISGTALDAEAGDLGVEDAHLQLKEQHISAAGVFIDRSDFRYRVASLPQETVADSRDAADSWSVDLARLNVSDVYLGYHVESETDVENGFDPNHIEVELERLRLGDAHYDRSIKMNINDVRLVENNGLELETLSGYVYYGRDSIRIEDFTVRTSRSEVQGTMVGISGLGADSLPEGNVRIRGSLNAGDLAYGLPEILEYVPDTLVARLEANVSRKSALLDVDLLDLSIPGMEFSAEGQGSGLLTSTTPIIDSMRLSLRLVPHRLKVLVPDSLWPVGITFPDQMALDAEVTQSADAMAGAVDIRSDMGNVETQISGHWFDDGTLKLQEAVVSFQSVEVGRWIQNDQFGQLDAAFTMRGPMKPGSTGFEADGEIRRLEYSGYAYRNVGIRAGWKEPLLTLGLEIDQPEIILVFDGRARFPDGLRSFQIALDVEKADLDSMHLVHGIDVAQGRLTADVDSIKPGMLHGSIAIRDVALAKGGDIYHIDSLLMTSVQQEDTTGLTVDSDMLSLRLRGNVPLLQIPSTIEAYWQRPVDLAEAHNGDDTVAAWLQFDMDLRKTDVLTDVLVPPLEALEVDTMEGELGGDEQLLHFKTDIPKLEYGALTVADLQLRAGSGDNAREGQLHIGQLGWGDFSVSGIDVHAIPHGDTVSVVAAVHKSDTAFLQLAADIHRRESTTFVHLPGDSIILNGQQWQAGEGNRLAIGDTLEAHNFRLWHGDEQIAVSSRAAQDLHVDMEDLDIAAIGGVIDGTAPLFEGALEAQLKLDRRMRLEEVQWTIDTLVVQRTAVGEVKGSVQSVEDGLQLGLNLQSGNGRFEISGTYQPGPDATVDLQTSFRTFDLSTIEPFAAGFSHSLQGTLDGELSIGGPLQAPDVNGALRMNDLTMRPVYLDTEISLSREEIRFEGDKVRVSDFTVTDARGESAVFDGTLDMQVLPQVAVDISFDLEDFLAFDTDADSDNIFFGRIVIDAEGQIAGALPQLDIDGDVRLEEGSTVSVMLPESSGAVIRRDRLIRFVDADHDPDPFLAAVRKEQQDTTIHYLQGLDLQANLEIDENSTLRLYVDQQFGDRLEVRGEGNLSFRLRPDGTIDLTGRYAIHQGSYLLNFQQLVKREFDILEGSFIQWTGAPTEARLNVEAQYQVETQAPVGDIAEPVPFNVGLYIKGELLSPDLDFGISMPEDAGNRYGEVAAYVRDINRNTSDLNKQVMSLIVFKQFLAGQHAGASSPGLSNTARSSLSRFLTQQLNNLSTGLEGFSVDVSLDSYETKTQEGRAGVTNLELGLSQSLFSDRLTIRVSGDVYLETPEERSDDVMDYLDDVTLEYELTPEGNLELVGFRQKEYDGLSQGEITETGIGIIYTKDYDRLRELFSGKKDRKTDTEQ